LVPKDANDRSIPYYHWWPKQGGTEWITYTFPEAATVQTTTIYWFDDQPWGGCKLPKTGKYITRMLQAIGLFENIQNTINARMWKHSSTHPTINSHDYRIRDHQQRHTENETTHLRHQKSKQTPSEYCTNGPSALRKDTELLRDCSVSFRYKSTIFA